MNKLEDLYPNDKTADNLTVSETGAMRYNASKSQMSYVPLDLCDGAARVMTFGAEKYKRGNYRKGFDPNSNLDSVLRHLGALQLAIENQDKDGSQGLLNDPDHGESHVHAVLANVWFTIHSMRLQGYKI